MKTLASRPYRYALGALCATLFSLWAWHADWRWGALLDNAAHDVGFRLRPALSPQTVAEKLPRSKNIVVIDLPPEVPRSLLADLLARLGQARVVVLDLMLADRAASLSVDVRPYFAGKGEIARWSRDDKALAHAMKKAGNVVIGIWPDLAPDGTLRWTRPSPLFVRSARSLAHFRVIPDGQDGIIRRVRLWENDGLIAPPTTPKSAFVTVVGRPSPTPVPTIAPKKPVPIPALSLAVAALWQHKTPAALISLKDNRDLWINFLGPRTLLEYPTKYTRLEYALEAEPEDFKNTLVFIGQTSFRSKDVFPTPYGDMPGLYIHAQSTATLLDESGWPAQMPLWGVSLIALGASLLLVALLLRASLGLCALFTIGEGLFLTLGVMVLWAKWMVVAPLSVPLLAIFLTYNFAALSEYTRTRDLVSLFVGRKMFKRVTAARQNPTLGGKAEVATAFFCDLRGYSVWAQTRTPQQLITALNGYTAQVVQSIEQFDGRVIDFFGDGVFVLFEGAGHAQRGVEAALAVSHELQGDGDMNLRVGVALHSGVMVIGYVGHPSHLKPGAVGEAVNIAARVQSFSDDYGYSVLLTRETLEAWRDDQPLAPFTEPVLCGSRPIKGYDGTLEIFGLLPLDRGTSSKIH